MKRTLNTYFYTFQSYCEANCLNRKINKHMRCLYVMSVALLVMACTEEMDIKLDSIETRLVVEASVTSDLKKHVVILKESSDVFYELAAIPVSHAIVSVANGDLVYEYTEKEPGYYESNVMFAGESGKTYSLSIKNVDINGDGINEEYQATSLMREAYNVDSISLHFDPNYGFGHGDSGEETWLLSLYMEDNVDVEDYYGFACRVNDTMVHDTITELVVYEDTYFNGDVIEGVYVAKFDQSKPSEVLKDLDTVTLETYAITKEYYDFVVQLQEMAKGQFAFSGPPGNISTNISNDAIGFFAVYAITRTSLVHNASVY